MGLVVEPLEHGFLLRSISVVQSLEHQRSFLCVLLSGANKVLDAGEQGKLLRLVLRGCLEVLALLHGVLGEGLGAVAENGLDQELHPDLESFDRFAVEGVFGNVLAGSFLVKHFPQRDDHLLLWSEAHVRELLGDFLGVLGSRLLWGVDALLVLLPLFPLFLPLGLFLLLLALVLLGRLRIKLLSELLPLPVLPPHLVDRLLFCRLVLRRVLDDERVQLVARVDFRHVAASLASQGDEILLVHLNHGLGVAARIALHELLDETLQDFREGAGVVRTVHDGLPTVLAELGLGPELATKVLGGIARWSPQRLGYLHHVHHVRLHAVTPALDTRLELGHLIPVKGIVGVVCADIDSRHGHQKSSPFPSVYNFTAMRAPNPFCYTGARPPLVLRPSLNPPSI
mmetsp:Transcript_13746/g.38721  ORF Transcript_13746/g.38721 Transcript_13746/m.38721 type:complete len:398 (-) Transcript_13746:566-1759(-)